MWTDAVSVVYIDLELGILNYGNGSSLATLPNYSVAKLALN